MLEDNELGTLLEGTCYLWANYFKEGTEWEHTSLRQKLLLEQIAPNLYGNLEEKDRRRLDPKDLEVPGEEPPSEEFPNENLPDEEDIDMEDKELDQADELKDELEHDVVPDTTSSGGGFDSEEEVEEEPESELKKETEIDKEYVGSKGENFYYLIQNQTDIGDRKDLQIVNQEGEKAYSAADNNLDLQDVTGFLVKALKEIGVTEVDYNFVTKYIIPQAEETVKEEEELIEKPEEIQPVSVEKAVENKVLHRGISYNISINEESESNLYIISIGDKDVKVTKEFVDCLYEDVHNPKLITDIIESI